MYCLKKDIIMSNLISIAVDADDVLFQTTKALLEYYNKVNGTSFERNDFTDYHIENKLGFKTRDEWYEFEYRYYKSIQNAEIELVDGAFYGINMLSTMADLHIVTSRPQEAFNYLMHSLSLHFSTHHFKYTHMITSSQVRTQKQKWEVCQEYGIPLLIDDHYEHVNKAALHGIRGILLEAPWNKGKEVHPLVQRAQNWDQIVEFCGF